MEKSKTETGTSARQRNRASTACTSCRKSRIRCIIESGQKICAQCLNHGHECIFDHRDGRKSRGSSKAFADTLCQRIEHLEQLLQHQGSQVDSRPTAVSPTADEGLEDDIRNHDALEEDEPPPYRSQSSEDNRKALTPARSDTQDSQNRSLVRKLVPAPVKFDMASGRVRFFGPTTNMNLLSGVNNSRALERRESHWPVAILVRDLSPNVHDYLMDLYWTCHNSVFHLVHRDAFYEELREGSTQFYSVFLHFAMLAVGFRYADKSREDISRLYSKSRVPYATSTLHIKAKSMIHLELEQPGGIPSIQALYLLADLECMHGRDDVGWMLSGMSFRLVFDVGLHVDARELKLAEREVEIRHMVLWACIINDRYYSLYLGRPSYFKTADIAPACLGKDFGTMISLKPDGAKTIETLIYEKLLALMELVAPICDLEVKRPWKTTDAYFKIAAVDRELNLWQNELPVDLTWSPHNIANGPASLYLLHTQFHTSLILLHRPFVNYGRPDAWSEVDKELELEQMNHFTMLSRTVCTDNAKKVAKIMEAYSQRFDLTQCFSTGLQHVGTAATALMAELVIQSNTAERKELLVHLVSIKQSIDALSKTYQPALLMSRVVGAFIRDFNPSSRDSGSSSTPVNTGPDAGNPYPSPTRNRKRSYPAELRGSSKRGCFGHINDLCDPPNGLPCLPSSWLEGLDFDDTEFLNLMGLKELQNSFFPGDGHFDAFSSHPA